jgi:two-component system sensor histidine kinase KdpD
MVQLARVEAGTFNTSSLAHVEEIVTIALERAEPLLTGHNVTVNIESDLPLIRVDARAIAEVIYNLVENAAKYSPPGTTITLDSRQHGDRVFVAVEDEGPGISEELREKVFEKFVRVGKKGADGLGLGLAIARGIVEAQNGTIEIKSGADDKGTRVVLTLPIGEE